MGVVLLSTYDMGRQPFGLASPAAWLREAGLEVTCVDLSRDRLPEEAVRQADLIGLFLPMHTATRLALPVVGRVRALNPAARLCAYGLYAPLNAGLLREHGVDEILGGEFEADLVGAAQRTRAALKGCTTTRPVTRAEAPSGTSPARLAFKVPDRRDLPSLDRYASLQMGDERRRVGYTEASRGCKHRCRHCPIVPVYDGRFRVVEADVVIADVEAQVAAGARHITFGDPDFFNGIGHARAVVERFGARFPGVTYDVTIKIEHLLRHEGSLSLLADTGCAFVTSAVESVDDRVLALLEKGHTRADFERAVDVCRAAGVSLAPTFVAFTPWTTLAGYCDLLQAIDRLELVEHVAPIQLAIRLLVPQGSRLLELPDVRRLARAFDPASLTHPWTHEDSRVDALQKDIERLVGVKVHGSRRDAFSHVWDLAHEAAGLSSPARRPLRARAAIPYLNEPWYC